MFAWIATRTGVQLPSPPAFARHVVESQGCRAVALAKADIQCAGDGVSTPPPPRLRSPRRGEPRLSRRSLGEGGHTVCVERVCCELRLGKPLKKNAMLCLRSILQSESNPEHFYTGRTDDLRDRLIRHNDGKVPHTAKWRPWRIKLISRFQTLNTQLSWNVT